MRKILIIMISMFVILSCTEENGVDKDKIVGKKVYKIGITQIITHPSLDLVKKGFKEVLQRSNLEIDFDEKSAEGNIAQANLIASNFKSDKKDLVFGIATPSAQALANNINDIPVLFSAVTDPVSANILNKNVTGTSDKLDNVKKQLEILQLLFPNVRKIGVLYNTSEQNSVIQIKELEEKAKMFGFEVVLQGITSFGELSQATKSILVQTDALYIPTDNLIVSGIKLVNSEAISLKKPVIVSENSSVELGSLFTMGLDYYELGKRTGEMAVEILKGKPVSEIEFETSKNVDLYINEETARLLEIDLAREELVGAILVKTKK